MKNKNHKNIKKRSNIPSPFLLVSDILCQNAGAGSAEPAPAPACPWGGGDSRWLQALPTEFILLNERVNCRNHDVDLAVPQGGILACMNHM